MNMEIIIVAIIIGCTIGIWVALYFVREQERKKYKMAVQKRKERKALEDAKFLERLEARPKTAAYKYRAGLKWIIGKDGAQQVPGIAKNIISHYSHHWANIMEYMNCVLNDAHWWKYNDVPFGDTPTIQYPIGGTRRIIAMQSMVVRKEGDMPFLQKAVLTFWIKGWKQSECDATLTRIMKVKLIIQDMGMLDYRSTVMYELVPHEPKFEEKSFTSADKIQHVASSYCAITFDYLTYALICYNEIKDARERLFKERDPYPFAKDCFSDWPRLPEASPWERWELRATILARADEMEAKK